MANTTRAVRRQAPVAPSTGAEWVNPMDNPGEANEKIARVLNEASTSPMPEIDFPADDVVILPGGLVRKDSVIKTVQVKELTGEDEEALARASQSPNPYIFFDRLLKCGVVKVGDEATSETEKLLGQLLIGDREAIILGIRKATYGDKIDIEEWICPGCGAKAELSMELSDIPVTSMTDPENETSFKVPLRKGGFAQVQLASGSDQLNTFEKEGLTQAQRETILLSRCVISITDTSGRELPMAGFPSMARSMSMPDRHAILRELRDRQPGPKYDKVDYTCDSCNTQQFVAVTIGNLFLDLGWI
jgi:hypothetical protein